MPKPRERAGRNQSIREQIAHVAARLIAVDGLDDFGLAKKKAARQVGTDDPQNLPTNMEIETALKAYRDIYFKDDHSKLLTTLREEAVRVMRQLAQFNPYLVGSVLSGTAGRYSDINIQLFVDSSKDVEIFLLNQAIQFRHLALPNERAEMNVSFYSNDIPISLAVYPRDELRRNSASRADGGGLERARIDQVEKMLEEHAMQSA
ncbi:hypothetical protein HNQ59_000740 [Chitinivorax tropicus]|uniref:Nucleotidyltransferase domain-containing protein n=1 Tax=Chitinivorax tropicus TaxID=714531 RepID=A0A840MLR6_9PROT|nr:hypothetical protein [Chitinivorax tropicus]MBB5017476.1 hypothetical protein [Chitinivorax tropicus]